MKPFNLQEALMRKPVVTRDGRKVFDIKYLPSATVYSVVGVISGETDYPATFKDNGSYGSENSARDLFMASEKKEGWINIYRDETANPLNRVVYASDSYYSRVIHSSKKEADEKQTTVLGPRLDTIHIEWEE